MPEPFQLIGIAHAQEAGAAAGGGGAAFLTSMMPIILIFALFYLLLIRPQQKRQKQHRVMLEALKKGDKVVTNGGLLGTVAAVTKEVLTVQVADNVRLRVLRSEIMGLQEEAGADAAKGSARGKEK
jgi:preprotein translocase subunit YajC